MFNLFTGQITPKISIASSMAEFWEKWKNIIAPSSYFEAQGIEHADIDLRLVMAIETILVPRLGRWEKSEIWWHQMDWMGDGVRHLQFRRSHFAPEFIPTLQRLLIDEHEHFTILCQINTRLDDVDDSEVNLIAICSKQILITRKLAYTLSIVI